MGSMKFRINQFFDFYDWTLSLADDRVKNWFLMQSYTPTIIITVMYLLMVWLGMKLMAKREPFQLKTTMLIYNAVLVVINFYIFAELLSATFKLNYSYSCQPVNYTDDPDELRVARVLWLFYISKLIEMLDTFFFVLRKKNKQISFLHVYHHSFLFLVLWIGVKWVAGGLTFFCALINSFIHVLMYSYYGLSALGPAIQKYLWWKKYLTMLQLLQFYVGMVYGAQAIWVDCRFPKWMLWTGLVYGLTIIALFHNFYIHAYLLNKPLNKTHSSKKESLLNGNDTLTANGHIKNIKEE